MGWRGSVTVLRPQDAAGAAAGLAFLSAGASALAAGVSVVLVAASAVLSAPGLAPSPADVLSDAFGRLSLMYHPLPLKTTPTLPMTRRIGPPHAGQVVKASSLNF